MEKSNTTSIGLHLVPGSSDNILAYSDGIADVEYEHLDKEKGTGDFQSEINKELKNAIENEITWFEDEEE